MRQDAPWLNFYDNVPHSLTYPDCSAANLMLEAAEKFTNIVAYDFFGARKTYRELADETRLCARGLKAIGIGAGDRVTICMPNTPQAVVMFYALNLIGAVANMVHPLSAPEELVRYMSKSRSVAVLTLDQFAPKLAEVLHRTECKHLILAGIEDGLHGLKKPLYKLTKGRNINRLPTRGEVIRYSDLLALAEPQVRDATFTVDAKTDGEAVAAIMYSGGTSGASKGILLTNRNLNALAMQTKAAGDCIIPGHKMLAIMPLFHGFGLGVCVHTALIHGATCVLVPQFSIETYAKLLKKYKPHYIPGVPTLFEALLRLQNIDNLDLSQLEGVFCGGDTLTVDLKQRVDKFLKDHGSKEQIREGFGMTECVTASCLTPRTFYKEGSIGIPYPDMYFKIVHPGSQETVPYGEDGEIVISGPTVMKGYDGDDDETAKTLQIHPDGRIWLHTGDLGRMDEDGFVYFRQRIKRMIISSGYNIYPSELENILEQHEYVHISCIIGVPDDYKMQSIKAFIVLRDEIDATDEIKASIIEHCCRNIAKYAMPREFEYRTELPRTMIGKVSYLELEQEELAKRNVSE